MTVSGIVNRFRMRVRLAKQTTNSTAKGLNMWVNSTIGLAAGFVFVALALCGVLLMLEARRSQSLATKTRLIVLHRISGYNYVILFCFVFYFMSQRLVGIGLSKNLLTAIVTHASLVPTSDTRGHRQGLDRSPVQGRTFFVDAARHLNIRHILPASGDPGIF